MHYIITGSRVSVLSEEDVVIHDSLPPARYQALYHKDLGVYLSKVNNLRIEGKLYGDIDYRAKRVLNTFIDKGTSMGVLMVGTKGSGKTMLAKLVSDRALDMKYPTILINENFEENNLKLADLLAKITTPSIIIFDEFEKVFSKEEGEQEFLLTLTDGTAGCPHLFIFTANNERRIDEHFLNRPGRIYYKFVYDTLDRTFIEEYCADLGVKAEYIPEIANLPNLVAKFNFDMLKALVEEMLRYDIGTEEALKFMNIALTDDKEDYDLKMIKGPKDVKDIKTKEHYFNPFNAKFYVHYETADDDDSYIYLTPSCITNVDKEGKVTYKVDGFEITAERKIATFFNLKDML